MVNSEVIEVKDLHKSYENLVAVNGISFEVFRGEIFGLLGPNGAGKTTTVECLQGLRRPTSGKIRVLGIDPSTSNNQLRCRIGSQLQSSELPQRIKVWEALDLFSSISGNRDWKKVMEQWDLTEKANASFSSLSGGQRQRLFIALALVNRPELVFLDEMTTGLDPVARHTAWKLIKEIRDSGTTVVLVTHFMDEAEELCDRLAIVDKGKIVALETPGKLVAGFSSSIRVSFDYPGEDIEWLRDVSDVKSVRRSGSKVEVEGVGAVLQRVAAALFSRGIIPVDFKIRQPSLEDVFLTLTGHQIEV